MKKRKLGRAAASRPQQVAAEPPSPPKRLLIPICLTLAAAMLAVYLQTAGYGYVAYDDDQYVYENPILKAGLTAANLGWAFTTFYYANWHPLTWVSYLLDQQLFGLQPGAQHMVNLALHLASTLLLFLALVRMTGRTWRCAVVAGIFALHPLHVESVAWISERKDALSTFFEMLTLWLYVRYVAAPGVRRYLAVALAFACSLLSKPMAVTFPLVLLLVDFWPLRRLPWPPGPGGAQKALRLAWEKLPLLAMAAGASVLTFLAQRGYGAVVSLNRLPVEARAANAAIAYAAYIGKAIWPAGLAVLYPAQNPAPGATAAALLLLAGITALGLRWIASRPYLLAGWLWYAGMLVPVIGLVQVGVQSMADRYTYVPLVGLSMALVWLVADFAEKRPALHNLAAGLALAALLLWTAAAYVQTGYWRNSRTLFEHTLAVTRNNHIIENNLGVIVARDENPAEAMALYRAALAHAPDYAEAHSNLGHALIKAGQLDEAARQVAEALRLQPNMALAHGDMGVLLAARGDYPAARAQLEESARLAPTDAEDESNLCFVLVHLGSLDQAIAHCHRALKISPDLLNAHFNLGSALAAQGRKDAAAAEFRRVLAADPNHAGARGGLAALESR